MVDLLKSKSKNTILENCKPNCPCNDQPLLPRKCPYCHKIFDELGWLGIAEHYNADHKNETGKSYKDWKSSFCKAHWSPQKYSGQISTNSQSISKKCPYCDKIFDVTWGGIDAHYKSEHEAEIGKPYKEWWSLFNEGKKITRADSSKINNQKFSRNNEDYSESINDDNKILVNITSSEGFKAGIWEKLNVNIQNMSEDNLKDIEIKLFGPVETNGNTKINSLKGKANRNDIVIGLKPKEPGNVPIRVEVTFYNPNGKRFILREDAFISVAKESETISLQQTPVINIGHIDRSTKIIDSVVQRSTIGAGARKCPKCGREVDANEKFCPECGAKL